jgi:hypothetical protein
MTAIWSVLFLAPTIMVTLTAVYSYSFILNYSSLKIDISSEEIQFCPESVAS